MPPTTPPRRTFFHPGPRLASTHSPPPENHAPALAHQHNGEPGVKDASRAKCGRGARHPRALARHTEQGGAALPNDPGCAAPHIDPEDGAPITDLVGGAPTTAFGGAGLPTRCDGGDSGDGGPGGDPGDLGGSFSGGHLDSGGSGVGAPGSEGGCQPRRLVKAANHGYRASAANLCGAPLGYYGESQPRRHVGPSIDGHRAGAADACGCVANHPARLVSGGPVARRRCLAGRRRGRSPGGDSDAGRQYSPAAGYCKARSGHTLACGAVRADYLRTVPGRTFTDTDDSEMGVKQTTLTPNRETHALRSARAASAQLLPLNQGEGLGAAGVAGDREADASVGIGGDGAGDGAGSTGDAPAGCVGCGSAGRLDAGECDDGAGGDGTAASDSAGDETADEGGPPPFAGPRTEPDTPAIRRISPSPWSL